MTSNATTQGPAASKGGCCGGSAHDKTQVAVKRDTAISTPATSPMPAKATPSTGKDDSRPHNHPKAA
jgi:hypothetical protein